MTGPVDHAAASGATPGAVRRGRRRLGRSAERVIVASILGSGTISILTTAAITVVLAIETIRFFTFPEVTIAEFAGGTTWAPLLGSEKHFGIWPLVCGTMLVTLVAACLALPFGLLTAVYLSEYAPRRLRAILKPVLEVLAGIPTVVYGYFTLVAVTPAMQSLEGSVVSRVLYPVLGWVRDLLETIAPFAVDRGTVVGSMVASVLDPNKRIESYNALGAGITVGVMTLPLVCSLSEDALQAVPRSLREGAYAVGSTKFDVSMKVVVPAALSGIVASFLLAIARAVGETMIVALAAGGLPRMTIDPRDQVQTMTGYMVQIFTGEASSLGVEYFSCYAVAAVLFVMTLGLTVVGHFVLKRFREAYE